MRINLKNPQVRSTFPSPRADGLTKFPHMKTPLPIPQIGIVIPVHNRESLIVRAIRSIQAQTFTQYEILVVDDVSTDNTRERVLELANKDPRIRLIRHAVNKGPSGARNTGTQATRARWVAFLDSDDEWHPEKLQQQMNVARDHVERGLPEPGFIYCAHRDQFPDGRSEVRRGKYEGDVYNHLLADFHCIPSTILVRRDVFDAVGGFDEMLDCWEDHDFALRVARKYTFGVVSEALTIRHMHDGIQQSSRVRGINHWMRRYARDVRRVHGRRQVEATRLRAAWSCKRSGIFLEAARHYFGALFERPYNIRTWKSLLMLPIQSISLHRPQAAQRRRHILKPVAK